jgi:hypothetical protein
MPDISKFQAVELADAWEARTGTETDSKVREVLRECADTLRMLANATPKFCPHAEPFVYCDGCKVSPCPLGLDRTGSENPHG